MSLPDTQCPMTPLANADQIRPRGSGRRPLWALRLRFCPPLSALQTVPDTSGLPPRARGTRATLCLSLYGGPASRVRGDAPGAPYRREPPAPAH